MVKVLSRIDAINSRVAISRDEYKRLQKKFPGLKLYDTLNCSILKSSAQAIKNTEQRRGIRDLDEEKRRYPALEILEEKIGFEDAKKVFGIFCDLAHFRSYASNLMVLRKSKESEVGIITKKHREWHIDTVIAHADMEVLERYGLFEIVEDMSRQYDYADMLERLCHMARAKK